MQNFIVLGYIPGTQTQISFWAWFAVVSVSILSVTIWRKRQQIKYWRQYLTVLLDLKRHPLK